MIRAGFGKSVARSTLIGGMALLAVLAIAGCEAGQDAPTLKFHPAAGGATAAVDDISISNAFVLGAPSGASVPAGGSASLFVSLYNGGSSDDRLLAVSAQGVAEHVAIVGGGVPIPASAAANLTGPEPEVVLAGLTKPLTGGQSVPVTFDFERAGVVTLSLPVEPQSYYYSTYSPPPASPTATPKASGSAAPTATPQATPAGSPSATPSPSR